MEPATVEEVLEQLKARPNDAELYQRLGGLYFERRELAEAWKAFMQSLRLDPEDPWTCLKFGTLLMLCDDKTYARKLFDHAIGLAPELAVTHWCSGDLYRKQGEYELAERAYKRAVAVDPDDEQAREKLAEWRFFIAGVRGAEPAPAATDARTGESDNLMLPPWVKYPRYPLESMFWRQGGGEWYVGQFRAWWDAQPDAVRDRLAETYPEPPGWAGLYAAWRRT
jgi:tetratricopeptide (TPR) repeat protein